MFVKSTVSWGSSESSDLLYRVTVRSQLPAPQHRFSKLCRSSRKMSFMEEARKGCSVQEVLLDFMTVVAGVVQLLVSVATAIKSDKNDNSNNNNK